MTALLAAFTFGTFWWYGVSFIWLILVIVALDKESGIALTLELIIYLAFLQWVSNINVFRVILDHPFKTLGYVAAYVIVGVLWSFIKWYLKVSEKADELKDEKVKFLKMSKTSYEKRGISAPKNLPEIDEITYKTEVPEKFKEEWHSKIQFKLLKASEHKGLIVSWVTYWPFSMLWSFLDDFVHQMISRLVTKFQKIYESITKRAMRDVL